VPKKEKPDKVVDEKHPQIVLEKHPCLNCGQKIMICDLHENPALTEEDRKDLKKAGVIFVRNGYKVKCPGCKKVMVIK